MHTVHSAVVDSFGKHPELAVALAQSGRMQALIEEAHRLERIGIVVEVSDCKLNASITACDCFGSKFSVKTELPAAD